MIHQNTSTFLQVNINFPQWLVPNELGDNDDLCHTLQDDELSTDSCKDKKLLAAGVDSKYTSINKDTDPATHAVIAEKYRKEKKETKVCI